MNVVLPNDLILSFSVFGWFQNMTSIAGMMTWFGICVVRVHSNRLPTSMCVTNGEFLTDLSPVPSWLGGPRPSQKPPPIQVLSSTLRGMVRRGLDHRSPPP